MADPLTPAERSERMSRVRSSGNKSTEEAVAARLTEAGITGCVRHPEGLVGKPDFYFPSHRLALFVDGCFWHACPTCRRRNPRTRGDFWRAKIDENRRRDNRQRRQLRRQGYHVMRVWEHEAKGTRWLRRLEAMMGRIDRAPGPTSVSLPAQATSGAPPTSGQTSPTPSG